MGALRCDAMLASLARWSSVLVSQLWDFAHGAVR